MAAPAGVAAGVSVEGEAGHDTLIRRVEDDFAFHPADTDDRRDRHEKVRAILLHTAKQLLELTPVGREQSIMLTELESVMHWCNSAIAKG